MPTTLSDFLGARATLHTPANNCSCPACTLLDCLERPRFFAGQVINETDLNDQMDYLRAKQRLQNRYLHGAGTVCGLEIVCNNCAGFVTVRPGYAISPCGDDIIVCEEQPFNVAAAINDCCTSRKSTTNCDPYRPVTDAGCTGLEQRWCITIKYRETQTQAITPLRNPRKSSTCGCGCNPVSGKNSGKNGTSACGCGASTPATPATPVQCEATRILEGYQLGIVPDPGTCDSAAALYGGTLFANLLQCVSDIANLSSQVPPASLAIVALAVAGNLATSGTSNVAAYGACCQLRQVVLTLFAKSSGITACAAVGAFEATVCPPLPSGQLGNGSVPQYLAAIQESVQASVKALFEAFRECICHDLLPPCPSDPSDDRLILACLTVKDGAIIDICNFGCRQFAGSFPSFFYWLSAVPIIPLLKKLVDEFCCKTETTQRLMVPPRDFANRPIPVQQAFMESNFALPRQFMQHLSDISQKFNLQGFTDSIPTGQVNLATLVGMNSQDAVQALGMHNVSFEQRSIQSRAEIPLSARAFLPFATRGDHVVLFETGGSIVDAQSIPASTGMKAVTDLQTQVASLRSEIDLLKRNAKTTRNK